MQSVPERPFISGVVSQELEAKKVRWFDECWLNARSKPLFLLRLFGMIAPIGGAMFAFMFYVIPMLSAFEALGLAGWFWVAFRWTSRKRKQLCDRCAELPQARALPRPEVTLGRVTNVSPIPRPAPVPGPPPPGRPPATSPRRCVTGRCDICDAIHAERIPQPHPSRVSM